MRRENGYIVFVEWQDFPTLERGAFETCHIRPANEDDKEYDGFNYEAYKGSEGIDIAIYPTLGEAIVNARFEPTKIEFSSLNAEEEREKDMVIAMLRPGYLVDLKNKAQL